MISEYCPRNCEWLNLTEEQQNSIKEVTGHIIPHACLKYDVNLYHMLAHPDLYKCEQCYREHENYESIAIPINFPGNLIYRVED